MNKKDYIQWHTEKIEVHNEKVRPFFHEREVWFCSMGENIGFEQDGRGDQFLRPVVIVRKFNNEVFWAVPLTTKIKLNKYYYSFSLSESEDSCAILSQLRLLDAKRLQYKIGDVPTGNFSELKIKLRQLLA